MFTITRIIIGGQKVWEVVDQREGKGYAPRYFKTKRAAQVAICSVVKQAMQ